MKWQERYLSRYYFGTSGWVGGTTEFWELCQRHIRPKSRILEIGAGPSNTTSRYLATLGRVEGADIDPEVQNNDALCAAHLINDGRLPVNDSSYDACVSNYVLEHVSDPDTHLQEVARVLRPGGAYIFRTPNTFHYISLIARATPNWFHLAVANRARLIGPDAHDPYPTYYRANSRASIKKRAKRAGLELVELRMVEKEPSYGMGSRILFFAFMGYERLVNMRDALAGFRSNIFGALQRPPLSASQ